MSNGFPEDRFYVAAQSALIFLGEAGVVPVLIGECALVAHGVDEETSDIDLLVDCNQSKLREIARLAKAAGYRIDPLSEQALRDGESAELRFHHEGVQIDLIPTSNSREKQIHARATTVSWLGTKVQIACLADVVVEKLRTGRATELEHVGPVVRESLSDCERRQALQDCDDLGLMTTHRKLISRVFGD